MKDNFKNLKSETFASSIYKKFRMVNSTSYLVDQGISIISSIVIARCVSSDALAAVSIISPLYCIVLFLTIVIADATANKVQLELGDFNKEKAGCVLITGMQYAVIIGILILLFFLFGKNAYFRFMNVSETTVQYAKEYLLFFQFSYALIPFNVTLDYFISDSGNIKIMYAKRVASLIGNTLLAFILTKWIGIAGIGLAHLITNITNICLMNTHFKSEYLAVKPKWMKMELGYIKALKGALAGGTEELVGALSGVLINKIIIARFAENADAYLSVLGILDSVLILECIFAALVQTARSQLDIYSVEGNYRSAKVLIKLSLRDSMICAAVLTLIYELGAPIVPVIYNITDPELADTCVRALRFAAAFLLCEALYVNYRYIHQGLQHFTTVALAIVCYEFVIYVGLMYVCTALLEETGIWIAYGISAFAAAGVIALVTWLYTLRHRERSFPWLLDKTRPQPLIYNIELSEEQVMAVRDDVSKQMRNAGADTRTIYRMALVIEEFGMLMAAKNQLFIADGSVIGKAKVSGYSQADKKTQKVLSEWDVWIEDDKVTTVVRDNGRPLDFSDENNSTGSLGAYFLSCLIPNIGRVNYATTVSMNRHRFQVSRTQQKTEA